MSIQSDDPDVVALFACIRAGQHSEMETLLKRRPGLARCQDATGLTPLHLAAEMNDPVMGVVLLQSGADATATYGQSGHTPLSWAVTCHALQFAQTLVRAGIKPDLFTAAGMGSLDLVAYCFDEQGRLRPDMAQTGSTRLDSEGNRLPCPPESEAEQIADALYMGCRNGQVEVVKFLLAKQPDLGFRAYLGGSLLHWAYFGCSPEVIDLMQRAGCNPETRDPTLHCTPRGFGICVPANWGFVELVEMQLRRDPSLARLMDGTTSALHEAAREGHMAVVKVLLQGGAEAGMKNGAGKMAEALAIERGHDAVVKLLGLS